ncbi:hypothetical protein AVEN_19365-1 [Araneus ventricosus]|uniref:Uncharacterized protein n=1 Tax=Araneus ventricosus TaxID=182803 RepID=A0A4Y2U5X9_ARAVE|nr:hypothetical protein AVEN_19365-1 [Araneus ventricosus]
MPAIVEQWVTNKKTTCTRLRMPPSELWVRQAMKTTLRGDRKSPHRGASVHKQLKRLYGDLPPPLWSDRVVKQKTTFTGLANAATG